MRIIRKLLQQIIDDIDAGNSNISEDESMEIAKSIGEMMAKFNKPNIERELTRTKACKYLRISESKFNDLRRKGIISEGKKIAGDVRKWSLSELDSYIAKYKE